MSIDAAKTLASYPSTVGLPHENPHRRCGDLLALCAAPTFAHAADNDRSGTYVFGGAGKSVMNWNMKGTAVQGKHSENTATGTAWRLGLGYCINDNGPIVRGAAGSCYEMDLNGRRLADWPR